MICTRPIRFTSTMQAHRDLLETLGGACVADHGDWLVYDLGHGRVALHSADAEHPSGTTKLGFESDDLHALAGSAAQRLPAGARAELTDTDHGQALVVTAGDGIGFTVDPLTVPIAESDSLISVIPMWLTTESPAAIATLEALGARKRIAGNNGVWTDFLTDSGLASVHDGSPTEISFNFEYNGEVDDLVAPLATAGIRTTVIDEAYARTLRIPDPDLPDAEIWITDSRWDLYGYQKFT